MAKASNAASGAKSAVLAAESRPFGRSLADFGELSSAEARLLADSRLGESTLLGEDLPDQVSEENKVRGAFLRFLALGGDRASPVHEKGIQLRGAYVEGDLDLEACQNCRPLWLWSCRFDGQIIARNAELVGISLDGSEVFGISADRLRCAGSFFMRNGFVCRGLVRLAGAEIGGDLDCGRSSFVNPATKALLADQMSVKGAFQWIDIAELSGTIDLTSASVASLIDDLDSWKKADDIVLNGFCYDRIAGSRAPTDADTRIEWLKLQKPSKYGSIFWPQPWEHLVKVLRDMGHTEDAKRVAIGKQQALRDTGLIGQRLVEGQPRWRRLKNRALNLVHRAFHRVYGALAGFGYRPLRTVGWMALVWFLCGLAYYAAAADGLVGPTNSGVYANARYERCGDGGQPGREHWTRCTAMPPEYTPFDPLVFSLDVILPLLDLKQETEWRPIMHSAGGRELVLGHALRFLMWFEILFGWVTSLLLVSVLGRLAQKD